MRSIAILCLISCLLLMSFGYPLSAVEVEFDYQYDTNGFFDDPARRELLEIAAGQVNRFVDELSEIVSTGENRWFTFPPLPPSGADTTLFDMEIPENTVRVIVGGNDILPVATLSQTNVSPAAEWTSSPETAAAWQDLLASRGQPGALASSPTDFANWGGVMMFNGDDVQWHFGTTTDGLDPEETDFLTVAMHELIHIFGFGPAESFQALTDLTDLAFSGSESLAVGSVNNRILELNDGGHWARGTVSRVAGDLQEALMGPVIPPGKRMFPTELDRAALRDVGWEQALPGDANLDRSFDTQDVVEVLQASKYNTGELAGWPDGDWNSDMLFNQLDIVAALETGVYLTGQNAALRDNGQITDAQTSIVYNPRSGALAVETPPGVQLTAINIDSAAGIFNATPAQNLGGSFDVDGDSSLFKATFGSSFGSISFGLVAEAGLSREFLLNDLTVIGSMAGGGNLGDVDLIFIPEPGTTVTFCLGLAFLAIGARRVRRK